MMIMDIFSRVFEGKVMRDGIGEDGMQEDNDSEINV